MGCCGALARLCCCRSGRRAGSRTGWEATIAQIKGRIAHAEQSRQRATATATFARSCAIAWVFLFAGVLFAMSRFTPALFAARKHLLALGILPCVRCPGLQRLPAAFTRIRRRNQPLLALFSRFATRYSARVERKRVQAHTELEHELDSLQVRHSRRHGRVGAVIAPYRRNRLSQWQGLAQTDRVRRAQDELPFNDVVELLRVYDTSKQRLTKLLANSPLQQEISKLQERNGLLREQTRDLAYLVLALTDAQMPAAVQRWMRAQMMPMARVMARAKPVLDRVRSERATSTPAARKVMERIQGTPSAAADQPSFLDEVMEQAEHTPRTGGGSSGQEARAARRVSADFTTPSPPIRLASARREQSGGEGDSSRSGSPQQQPHDGGSVSGTDSEEEAGDAPAEATAAVDEPDETVAAGTRQRSTAGRKG